jgi:hypothetical protein
MVRTSNGSLAAAVQRLDDRGRLLPEVELIEFEEFGSFEGLATRRDPLLNNQHATTRRPDLT